MRFSAYTLSTLTLSIALFSVTALGQVNRGSITGQVQDQQSALEPGATLTLTNEQTGTVQTSKSLGSGEYSFVNLTPGLYRLDTVAPGFGHSVEQHITVAVGSTVALTITLVPASVEAVVTVNAQDNPVETQTSDIGTVITPREISDLPVPMSSDMRNPLSFVTLTPGVAGSEPGAQPDYRLHISGSPSYSNETYIDGIPVANTALSGDVSLNHPPIDAISEFKVVNNNQSAQYGLASSAVSFAFKSGTNQYHGSLFEFLQNDKLDANGFVGNALKQPRAPLKQNEYGGTFGGPIHFPKLYNGHDKSFFFVEYTRFSWRPSSNNASLTTFPNAYRTGNFAQALGPQLTSGGQLVFDAAGRPVYAGEIYDPHSLHSVIGPDGKTYQVRDPFPNNQVPTTDITSQAAAVLTYFPMANSDAINNNFFRVNSTKNDEDRLVVRIDHTLSQKQNISGSVFIGNYNNGNNGSLTNLDSAVTVAPTKQFRFTDNYTFSPRMSNNLNIGFLRDHYHSGTTDYGPGLDALGIDGLPTPPGPQPFPEINLLGNLSTGINPGAVIQVAENRYIANDNFSVIRANHSFTFGGEYRQLQRNKRDIGIPEFNFDAPETGLNGTGFAGGSAVSLPVGTGNSGASFLLGAVDLEYASFPIQQDYRWEQIGMYAQDDWKVNQSLVLNLGVRYDIEVPRRESSGYASTVDVNLPNPAAGNLPGAYTFYGTGPGRNGKARIGNIDWKAVQPRIGFSWAPYANKQTAFRGGYAITRPDGNDDLENGIADAQYSIGYSGTAIASKPNDVAGSPAYYWNNPFPASGVAGASLDPGILVGITNPVIIYPKAGSPPTQMNWALQVQQEMPGKLLGTIAYVGAHSYHIGVWSKPNQINPASAEKYRSVAATLGIPFNEFFDQPITSAAAAAAGISAPWTGFANAVGASAATIGQALRPFPQYGSVDNPINPIGSVSYNGLQSSLQRRFSNGLTALLSYTYSKTIGNVDSNNGISSGAENGIYASSFYQDYYNPRGDRSVTSSDVPHVIALSYTYELPLGRGKRFLNKGGVTNAVLGQWEVSGIQQYQSGRPIHIEYDATGSADPYRATDGYSFRTNIVPGQPFKNPAYRAGCSGPISGSGRNPCQFYVNPAAFAAPTPGEFGNAPHYISALRLPWFLNENLSASKRFHLYDRANLQFQANFFNAFNRVVFSNGGNANTFIYNSAPADLSATSLANSGTVFGILSDQQNGPRMIQFALKLEF